jgi:hypothetical protein
MCFSDLQFTAPGVSGILTITRGTSSSAISRHWHASDQYSSHFPVAEIDAGQDRGILYRQS